MGYSLFFLSFLLSLNVAISGVDNSNYTNPDVPLANDWKKIRYIHIIPTTSLKAGNQINAGDKIGDIASRPVILSEQFDSEIKKSISYYKVKEYKKAVDVLSNALIKEPNNYFILEAYARACYWIDKKESFRVYKTLVEKIDATNYLLGFDVALDYWFFESYWKLGTLYMDFEQYDKAYFEISRSLVCMMPAKGQYIYCQALEYLTECAYMMEDDYLARYFANRTLFYDPKNEYVKEILKKINAEKSKVKN